MKKFYLLPALALASVLSFTSCSDDDDSPVGEQYSTISFEGSYWDALIDSHEYGGTLLYGASGYGYEDGEAYYSWTDTDTQLHSSLNYSEYGTAFWNGGVAVSNYHCDIANGSSTTQLSIPTDVAAHSGNNFLVAYGYYSSGWDSRAVLDFADSTPRVVRGLWVTPTSYFLHSTTEGDGFNTPATITTYVDVVFEGYDADGKSTGSVKQRLQDGTKPQEGWAYVDLTPLGEVVSVKINFEASDDQIGSYGLNTPAYVAIDDIEIRK